MLLSSEQCNRSRGAHVLVWDQSRLSDIFEDTKPQRMYVLLKRMCICVYIYVCEYLRISAYDFGIYMYIYQHIMAISKLYIYAYTL